MIPVKSIYPPGVVGVITGELTRYARFMQDFCALQVPAGTRVAWVYGPSVKRNVDEVFVQALRWNDTAWVWLIGDDHTFLGTTILSLLAREKECVIPLCLSRTPPIMSTIQKRGRNLSLLDLPLGGTHELKEDEVCGDAGMLITRAALEKVGPPWQDGPATGTWDVEDRAFCQKLRVAGVSVFVDLDCVLGHITPVELIPQKRESGWKVAALIDGMEVT